MLRLKNEELSVLVYHLGIMRNPTKKGLKKKHDRKEVKEYIGIYDSIVDKLLEINIEDDIHDIQLSTVELELLQSFFPWYIEKLESELLETEKDELSDGIDVLKTINNMLLIHAV
ncbi:hypothetical protein QA612_09700 [Evansella sp. AB-P1]|uniref:hypothetical protein n=1 Tax=Evansella sp. AB-P1 TaxID=3037653 RepID=UPI00241DA200|nr:hypothetical protein [Evansella sp. AB-P1]MDG5787773.1 hypothetical protein [Evansella sp. AB-P1]